MAQVWNRMINIVFWSFFGVSSFVLFIGAVIIRIITAPFDRNRRILQKYSCFWASLYIWVNPFWSVRIHGLENVDRHQSYVMVSNHQSMADILVLFRSFLHFKWVSKKSLFKTPLLGWNMWLNGYVPIERGDAASRECCMKQCKQWIQKGSSVVFFPEGTRSKDKRLQPFKIGAFLLAYQMGVPILPLVIRGSHDAIPKHSAFLHGKSAMSLEILPPIPIEHVTTDGQEEAAKKMSQKTWQLIRAAL